ncbi:unnamed protein product [Clonostachys rosea f. rosea IK726]|uniref:Uncharacterized protein n=1 Tax=Clonostachys rosea f. rosea IK726 TaxID=1349383 RepID=A0ACA9U1J8_BIOOC|nr:unnamed protein product [Clonostachys rosea f. rosea IK726]
MTDIPSTPTLTPQFCFSSGTLRDFLRLSRSGIDDSITQNLNALVTPARAGFDPSSTSHRTPSSVSRQISPKSCQSFKEKALFPAWEARREVLFYYRDRVVDERLDPYSGRFFPREARTETLASLIRQENSIENIVKSRTWSIVQQRCGGSNESWEKAVEKWRESRS